MKSLLARLSLNRAVGVYIGDDEIAVSQVAATLLGAVEIHQHREKYQADELAGTLARVLEPLVGKRRSRRRLVAFGLPPLRVFFSSRPLKATNVEATPKILLHEVLRSPSSNVDEMAIDLLRGTPGKRPVVTVVSCRKKYLAGLLANMQQCDIRPYRVEPAPCAILRAAEHQHRAPRKAKTVLRLFLGETQGLAVLAVSGWPLMPRSFEIVGDDVTTAIISAVRTLEILGKLCGTDSAIDALLVHGRAELRSKVDLDTLESQIGLRIQWHEGPSPDSNTVARGLALGCIKSNAMAFDLARSMKPRESLWELMPWAELAVQLTIAVCLGLFLFNHSQDLNTKYAAIRSETDGRHWLTSRTQQQLDKEKQELEQRVDSIRKFLSTRVVWSTYTHDIPRQLPENSTLNSFHGVCETEKKGRKDDKSSKPKNTFTMRIGAPITSEGAVPKEVDEFLDALRDNESLKRDFPLVELADIKWFQPFIGAQPTAFFTVVCLPKPTNAGAPAMPAEKSTK